MGTGQRGLSESARPYPRYPRYPQAKTGVFRLERLGFHGKFGVWKERLPRETKAANSPHRRSETREDPREFDRDAEAKAPEAASVEAKRKRRDCDAPRRAGERTSGTGLRPRHAGWKAPTPEREWTRGNARSFEARRSGGWQRCQPPFLFGFFAGLPHTPRPPSPHAHAPHLPFPPLCRTMGNRPAIGNRQMPRTSA